jgi:hypothetical protein
MIRRREFIAGLGGAAAWPLAAPANDISQQWRFATTVHPVPACARTQR